MLSCAFSVKSVRSIRTFKVVLIMHHHHWGFPGHPCHPGHFPSMFPGHFPPMFHERRFPGHHHHHRGWHGHRRYGGNFETHQHPFSFCGPPMWADRGWGRRCRGENDDPQNPEEQMLQIVRAFFEEEHRRHGRRGRCCVNECSADDEGKISEGTTETETTTESEERGCRGKRYIRKRRFSCAGWTYGKCNAQQGRTDESSEVHYGWHYNPTACQFARDEREGRSNDEEPCASRGEGKRRRRRGMSMACRKLGRRFQCCCNEEVSRKTAEAMEINERTPPAPQGEPQNTESEVELEEITDDLKKSNLE